MRWFIRHHSEISALVLGFEERWCADRMPSTRTLFPFWLYGDSDLVYIANMLSTRTIRDSADRVMFALGRNTLPRQDGYDDYEIGRKRNFRPIQTFAPREERSRPSIADLAKTAPSRSFPALDALDDVLRILPAAAKVVVVLPPQYAARVSDDDGALDQGINACKVEFWRRTRPRGAFADFLVQSPITRNAENFWDDEHYTSSVARTVEAGIVRALNATSPQAGLQLPQTRSVAFLFGFAHARRGGLQLRHDFLGGARHQIFERERRVDETHLAHVIEQLDQRLPETVDVGQQHRLLVPAELRPRQLLDQLLQRADAAGQGDEGVGAVEHDLLALMHVAGDDHLGVASEGKLPRPEELRDHADDLAAALGHAAGDCAHQPGRAAAIDQCDVVVGHDPAEGVCRRDKGRIAARTGTAVDANGSNRCHGAVSDTGNLRVQAGRHLLRTCRYCRKKRCEPSIWRWNRACLALYEGRKIRRGTTLRMRPDRKRRQRNLQ
jgi:hypothetical protein